jgi:putative peptidoglycan lipid II flippase
MLSVLISSICGLIILLWQLPVYGVRLAAWVQLLINTVPAILLLPILGRAHQIRLDFGLLKQVWRRMRPIMLGAMYYRTYFLGDRLFASFLTPGSIVILDMCQRVHNAIARVLNQGIITPVVPRLARLAEENKCSEFSAVIHQKTVEVLVSNTIILTLISICALVTSRVAPTGILRHAFGSLSPGAWTTLFVVFFYMSGLLFGSSLSHTFTIAYYAGGDTVTPTKIGIVIYTVGLALKALGFIWGGLTGIALAISFYNILYAVTLRYYLKPSRWNAMEGRAHSARLGAKRSPSHVAPNLTGPTVIRSEPTRLIHRATDEGSDASF